MIRSQIAATEEAARMLCAWPASSFLLNSEQMTANQFRKIALRQLEAVESSHMGHADFRVGGKIFATLGYPDERHAVVILPAGDQSRFVQAAPDAFASVKGAWGRNGATQIDLGAADMERVEDAICLAWCKRAPARLLRGLDTPPESDRSTSL